MIITIIITVIIIIIIIMDFLLTLNSQVLAQPPEIQTSGDRKCCFISDVKL